MTNLVQPTIFYLHYTALPLKRGESKRHLVQGPFNENEALAVYQSTKASPSVENAFLSESPNRSTGSTP